MGPPSQMMYNKMGHNGPPGGQGPPNHQMPPYGGQQNPNYPGGHPYGMRMHGYGPGGPYPGPQGNNMPMGGQQHYLAITSNNIIISKVPGEVPVVHLHNSNLA